MYVYDKANVRLSIHLSKDCEVISFDWSRMTRAV